MDHPSTLERKTRTVKVWIHVWSIPYSVAAPWTALGFLVSGLAMWEVGNVKKNGTPQGKKA
jgi:hypothetical protein